MRMDVCALVCGRVCECVSQEFARMAMDVCSKAHDAPSLTGAFPRLKDDIVPFLCADLSYCSQLMTAGFKLHPEAQITLVRTRVLDTA